MEAESWGLDCLTELEDRVGFCLLCRYCDASGAATEAYPFNPNGSPEGIAALTSPDGRHLALMPHPERCFLTWQNPWCETPHLQIIPKSGITQFRNREKVLHLHSAVSTLHFA